MGGAGRSSEAKVQPLDKGKDGASCDKGLTCGVGWTGGRGSAGGFGRGSAQPGTQGCREQGGSLGMLEVGRDPLEAR